MYESLFKFIVNVFPVVFFVIIVLCYSCKTQVYKNKLSRVEKISYICLNDVLNLTKKKINTKIKYKLKSNEIRFFT